MKILVGGDISFGRIYEGKEIHYGTDGCLTELALIPRDYSIFNLESPLTRKPRVKLPKPHAGVYLYGEISDVRHLLDSEVDYLSLANNHAMDFASSVEDTISTLDKVGISHSGTGTDYLKPHIDHDLGLVVFSADLIGKYGYEDPVCCGPYFLDLLVKKVIPHYRKLLPDYAFLCCVHWGAEYEMPTEEQKRVGKRLIDCGVDMVIGHHPHVIQPMEVYKGKPIFYSLGNLYFTHHRKDLEAREDTHLGCLSLVEMDGREYIGHTDYHTWTISGERVFLL